MEFSKYSSIENAYQQKYIDKMCATLPDETVWVVMEKVHGANFSFSTDGKEVKIAKRTAFIGKEEEKAFYNCSSVIEKYSEKIIQIFHYTNAKNIIVYGELFGGFYPGIASAETPIQKGINYCPHHEFFAFDIKADGKFLNYDEAIKLFEKVNLIYARILFRGTLQEALKWSDEHKSDASTIPGYFGLPVLAKNKREGHVLKPVESKHTHNGARIMLKDKNSTFSEKQAFPKEKVECDPALKDSIMTALEYITPQRYDNVVSKIGEVSKKDMGKLVGLLSKDAIEDYLKEHGDGGLEKKQLKTLFKAMNERAKIIVMNRLF